MLKGTKTEKGLSPEAIQKANKTRQGIKSHKSRKNKFTFKRYYEEHVGKESVNNSKRMGGGRQLTLSDLAEFKALPKGEKLAYLYTMSKSGYRFKLFERSFLGADYTVAPPYDKLPSEVASIPKYYDMNIEFLNDWKHFIKCFDISRHTKMATTKDLEKVVQVGFDATKHKPFVYEGTYYDSKAEFIGSAYGLDLNSTEIIKKYLPYNLSTPVMIDYWRYRNTFGYYDTQTGTIFKTLKELYNYATEGDKEFFLDIKPTLLRYLTLEEIVLGVQHCNKTLKGIAKSKESMLYKGNTYGSIKEILDITGATISEEKVLERLNNGYDLTSAVDVKLRSVVGYKKVAYNGVTYADIYHMCHVLHISEDMFKHIISLIKKRVSPERFDSDAVMMAMKMLEGYCNMLGLHIKDTFSLGYNWTSKRGKVISKDSHTSHKGIGIYPASYYTTQRGLVRKHQGVISNYVSEGTLFVSKSKLLDYYREELPEYVYVDMVDRRFVVIKDMESYLEENNQVKEQLKRYTDIDFKGSNLHRELVHDLENTHMIVYNLTEYTRNYLDKIGI